MTHLFAELGLVLMAVYAAGQAVEVLGKPAFLGELGAGVVVGPYGLGLVAPEGVVHVFATVGAASLFFHVGFEEVDLEGRFEGGRSAAVIAAFGMAIPFLSGLALGRLFGYDAGGTLFLAVALSITSIAITVRTLVHLGSDGTAYADKLVGAAVIDDVAGMVAFSLLLVGVAGSAVAGTEVLLVLGKVAGFFLLAAVVHLAVADPLFGRALPTDRPGGPFLVFGALLALFAAAAEAAGLHATIGAFVAGLIASYGDRTAGFEGGDSVEAITYGVFGPVFFAAVGMRIDLSAVTGLPPLLFAVVTVGVLTKVAGGYLGNRAAGGDHGESLAVGVGLVPRTGVELVIVSVALSGGFIGGEVYAAFVVLVVVSVLLTPLALQRLAATPGGPAADRPG